MIKKCSKCGEEKPETAEYFHKRGNRLRAVCKVCHAEYCKAYYEEKKEDIKEYNKAYRKEKKEAIAERKKAHYEAHKGDYAERHKAYSRTPKGKFVKIKQKAKKRNINFSLSFDLYESQLWGKPCHYCGCEIEATGLDRKDNDKGYEVGNVVPCCLPCNNKKRTKPYQAFIEEMINE